MDDGVHSGFVYYKPQWIVAKSGSFVKILRGYFIENDILILQWVVRVRVCIQSNRFDEPSHDKYRFLQRTPSSLHVILFKVHYFVDQDDALAVRANESCRRCMRVCWENLTTHPLAHACTDRKGDRLWVKCGKSGNNLIIKNSSIDQS